MAKKTAKKKPVKKTTAKKSTAKKKPAAKKKASKKNLETLFVASKVKDSIRSHKMNVAGDALEGLNEVIHRYIEQASTRAGANGRKTVRAHDFTV